MKKYTNSIWEDLWVNISDIQRPWIRKPWVVFVGITAVPFFYVILCISTIKFKKTFYMIWDNIILNMWKGKQ